MNDCKNTSYPLSGKPLAKGRIAAIAGEAQRRPIVLVLGMPRSGMSLCAHILSAMGIDIADEISAHASSASDQWERREIVEFHDRILGLFNRAYFGPFHDLALPVAWWADRRVCDIRREIVAFLQERMGDSYFGFTDPRTVRLMPVWHHILSDLKLAPKVVLCLRNPFQVARSLMARDGVDLKIGEYRWLIYMIDFFRYTHGFDVCTIEYEGWFNDPLANFEKLRKFLDLRWQQSEFDLDLTLSGIIDPALNHGHSDHRKTSQSLVCSLHELASRAGLDGAIRERISDAVSQFVNFQQVQRPLQQAFEEVAEVAAKFPELEQEAASLRAAIGERDQIVEAANGRARAAEARLAELEQEAVSLRAAIGERDQIVEAANGRASAAEARLAELEQEAASLRAAIGERDRIVEVANGRASAAQARSAELEQEAALLRVAIGERDQIVATANGRASATQARLAELEQEVASLRAAIGERDQIVATTNARASATQARLAEALQRLEREAQEGHVAAEAMQAEIAGLRSELDVAREVVKAGLASLRTEPEPTQVSSPNAGWLAPILQLFSFRTSARRSLSACR
jgi:hypothetical protein